MPWNSFTRIIPPSPGHNKVQRQKESPYNLAYFVLNVPRPLLYQRIDERVDEMIKNGLIEEVMALKDMGCRRGMVSMQGLGYKEILAYLEGEYSPGGSCAHPEAGHETLCKETAYLV